MTDQDIRRRAFLATAAAATGSALAGCSSSSNDDDTDDNGEEKAPDDAPTTRADELDRYPRIRVGSVDDLSTGNVETFAYPLDGMNNFLTRLDGTAWGGVGPDDSIVAYSSLCTHMGCTVSDQITPEQEMVGPCPCHYTTFDLSKGGLVIGGAATTDLPQVRLEVEGGDIYATGIDGLVYGQRHNLRDGEPVEAEQ